MEFRRPTEADSQAIRELAVLSFNVPVSWARGKAPPLRTEHYLCAYEGDLLLGTTRDIPMLQWFGGRPLPAAGVASVATVPERRSTGLGNELMRALLTRARERGAVVTTLYPATVPFYRRLGYEYAGTQTIYDAPLSELPRGSGETTVERFEGDDVRELRACYRAFAEGKTGLVEGDDDEWWTSRVLAHWIDDVATRAVVARGPDGVEGYATFSIETRGDWKGFDVDCMHLVATTPRALVDLTGYFRRYKGVGRGLVWQGPPNEPLGLLVAEETINLKHHSRYMSRVLDVHGALEGRGYPEAVSGEAVIAVDDPLFEENQGAFRITAESGKVRVERTDEPGLRIAIGALSALFSNYVSPADLAAVGTIDGRHRSVGFLSALFAGPAPWMIDHF
jgi:predicted acetyltransferase